MVWDKIFTDSLLGYISKGLQNRYPHCHAKYCNGYYEAGKRATFLVYLWELDASNVV
jgi:hypothetical protein